MATSCLIPSTAGATHLLIVVQERHSPYILIEKIEKIEKIDEIERIEFYGDIITRDNANKIGDCDLLFYGYVPSSRFAARSEITPYHGDCL